jgi:hypothetical protein
MTTSRERAAAGIPQAVLSGGRVKMSYLTLGDGPGVIVIPGGVSSDC